MGFLKPVQNFLKKYTALLPSIGIVIVAVLLMFPTLMVGKGVKEKMEKSSGDGRKVSGLANSVPSKDDPGQIKLSMDRLEDQATQIELLMRQSSQRELISYDIFPPKSTSSQLYTDFGQKYQEAIEALVNSVNALDAPSDSEIQSKTGGRVRTSSTRRQSTAATAVDPMIDALCLTRSQEISVYAHPSLFAWYEFWEDYDFQGEDQALEDCWDAQVAFWIYKDIIDTIGTMNQGSQSVSSSAVKRLMGVSFSSTVFDDGSTRRGTMSRSRSRSRAIGPDKPNYVIMPDPTAANTMGRGGATAGTTVMLPSNFMDTSLTGRQGDADVDVVHFAFSVLVDNRLVMAFMKELCSEKSHTFRTDFKEDGEEQTYRHNQISILQSDLSVVDKQLPEHELYRYGKGAVMQLDLICEYQFVRKGYDSIKPAPVKTLLGQSDDTEEEKPGKSPGTGGVDDFPGGPMDFPGGRPM